MTKEEKLKAEIRHLRCVLAQIDELRDINEARSLVRNTLNEVWVRPKFRFITSVVVRCPHCGYLHPPDGVCLEEKPMAKDKMEKVMHEYKHGELRSGTGKPGQKGGKVKSRKQAIAIALSEAGKSKKK